jgi:uncharacterized protein
VGLIGGAYGIGGGSIMAPFLVAVFQLPVYTIAGSALTATCITSVAGVIIFAALSPFMSRPARWPRIGAWASFSAWGVLSACTPAPACSVFFSAKLIRIGLGLVITSLAVRYVVGFFLMIVFCE